MSERIYRLVAELYLDWIFSCINRGKIITWLEVVLHTQTTLLDKRIKVTLDREQGKSQSSSQLC